MEKEPEFDVRGTGIAGTYGEVSMFGEQQTDEYGARIIHLQVNHYFKQLCECIDIANGAWYKVPEKFKTPDTWRFLVCTMFLRNSVPLSRLGVKKLKKDRKDSKTLLKEKLKSQSDKGASNSKVDEKTSGKSVLHPLSGNKV